MTDTNPSAPDDQDEDELAQLSYGVSHDGAYAHVQQLTEWSVRHGRKVRLKLRTNGTVKSIEVIPLSQASLTEHIDNNKSGALIRPEWGDYVRLRDDLRQAEQDILEKFKADDARWSPLAHPGKHRPQAPKISKISLAKWLLLNPATIGRMMLRHHLVNGRGVVWDIRVHPPSSWPEEHPPCPKKSCRYHRDE